jgi:hypothetical protein
MLFRLSTELLLQRVDIVVVDLVDFLILLFLGDDACVPSVMSVFRTGRQAYGHDSHLVDLAAHRSSR